MARHTDQVLIVDDDAWTRYALARLFERLRIPTVVASNLSEGLAFLTAQPSCVILDLNLPDGPGETILRVVREQRLSCRVVVCTVGVDPNRMAEVARLVPDAMFLKPAEAVDLARACQG